MISLSSFNDQPEEEIPLENSPEISMYQALPRGLQEIILCKHLALIVGTEAENIEVAARTIKAFPKSPHNSDLLSYIYRRKAIVTQAYWTTRNHIPKDLAKNLRKDLLNWSKFLRKHFGKLPKSKVEFNQELPILIANLNPKQP